MQRTPLKVVIPSLIQIRKKYANYMTIMLIYVILWNCSASIARFAASLLLCQRNLWVWSWQTTYRQTDRRNVGPTIIVIGEQSHAYICKLYTARGQGAPDTISVVVCYQIWVQIRKKNMQMYLN